MNPFINLVATRSRDGDHAALLRWYSDHVHILMGFPALWRASLYRSSNDRLSAAPEYVCLYEFPSHADFLAFEESEARSKARQIVEAGWARSGIEITQRTQYQRLGRRSGNARTPAAPALTQLQCLSLGAGSLSGVSRWLSDRVHQALADAQFGTVAWHRAWDATDAGGDALVLLEAPGANAAREAQWADAWRPVDTRDDAFGQAPSAVAVRWQAPYQRVACWRR